MNKQTPKFVIAPMDGSKDALRSIDYIHRMYPVDHHLKIGLIHILPALPAIMGEEAKRNPQTAKQLKLMENKIMALGTHILEKAQDYLLQKGFQEDRVEKIIENNGIGIARDINVCVEKRLADALIISASGKSWLEGFFTSEITNKLVEIVQICPVWVIKGDVKHSNVLIALDGSQNSLRSVDHAGFMLAGTKSRITLMHITTSLNRFFPKEVLEVLGDYEDTWMQKTSKDIEPSMIKAKEMLITSGIAASQIDVRYVDGGRRLAKILLQEAEKLQAGTIVMGRSGRSDAKNYSLGSITRKVLNASENMAIWITS